MTETLLKQLYNAGEIYPGEAIICKDPEYRELTRKISEETEYFKSFAFAGRIGVAGSNLTV